ncbi:hypothetical protein [Candidatus Hepatoplasma crinochetorum]|uniref:hypothetical protein n=1 Tax=Candidatus Hepatoplasma crinochetorum TaxID=295596 RepID=UPI00308B1A20|nr:MAG: hypothetical protein HCTKY_4020 [Candidatus Hepatoplasma crinochetorum]
MKDNSKETTNIETTNINNPEQKISRKEQQKLDWKNSNKRLWPILIFWIWFLIMSIGLGILIIIDAGQGISDTVNSDNGMEGFIIFLQSLWIFIAATFYIILIIYSGFKIYKTASLISDNNYYKHRLFVMTYLVQDQNKDYSKHEIKTIYKQNKNRVKAEKDKAKAIKAQKKAEKKLTKTKKKNKKKY